MFNLGWILRFLRRALIDFIEWVVLISGLAILTEVLTQPTELPGLLFTLGFWISVGFNMLPYVIVTLVVLWLAGRFLRSVYDLSSWQEGVSFLLRSRYGQPGFSPWIKVEEGQVTANADSFLGKIGGPGHLIVYHDSAVVLEKGGRLTQVVGPGFPRLKPFEKIYDVVDLRLKRWVYPVKAMTKEGIDVTWDAEVHYKVADDDQQPTEETPYPLSKEDVFRAATCLWRREIGKTQDLDWEGRIVVGETEGILRSILAKRCLDQLIGLTDADERAAREAVQEELERKLRKAVYPELGAKIVKVNLGNLKVNDAITQQWIEAWKADWQRWSHIRLAQGEADRIRHYEKAKAEAQIRMVVSITHALQELDYGQAVTSSVILMRLFSALDRARLSALDRKFYPGEAIQALDTIQGMLRGDNDTQ